MEHWQGVSRSEKPVGIPGPVSSLDRLKVPGGWLYRATEMYMAEAPKGDTGGLRPSAMGVALAFVPETQA